MLSPSPFAAQILETSASAYAAQAAHRLLERYPEVGERASPGALRVWKVNLTQRVLELSAAVEMEEPRLFAMRIGWLERAFRAREAETADLRHSLICLRETLAEELPEMVRGTVDAHLEAAFEAFGRSPANTPDLNPENPQERLTLRYLEAVLGGDARKAIDLVVQAVDSGLDPRRAYLEVLLPAQRQVGGLWHLGELSIAEEHFVTTTTERAMAVLAQRADRQPTNGYTVVAAAVAGNAHGLAARVLADFFEIAGWRAICLGADVPENDLVAAAQYFEVDLMVLSVALSVQLKAARRSIAALRKLPGRDVKVLVGGFALVETPDLWRHLGADGHPTNASEAVTLGERLLGATLTT